MFSKPSPSFARKGHQQITGSDADEKDLIIAGVQFVVRYIGSTEVACANGTGSGKTEKPVSQIFDQQRRNGNGKAQKKMLLTLCSKSVSVLDDSCGKLVASFPISKITFCNIDNFYEKAFVFVARDKPENPFKAFLFTCESKAKAREAFKALSLAFIINYECYQASSARGTSNTSNANGSSESHADRDNEFFNGVSEAGYGTKYAEERSSLKPERSEHCSDAMPVRKDSCPPVVSGYRPATEERVSIPPLTRPIQNKAPLQVPDCRRHVRSASDPAQFGRATTQSGTPSPLAPFTSAPHTAAPNSHADAGEVEDPEFTEFAELRSKCRSSSSVLNKYSGSVREAFQRHDCQNFWGDFQNACSAIY